MLQQGWPSSRLSVRAAPAGHCWAACYCHLLFLGKKALFRQTRADLGSILSLLRQPQWRSAWCEMSDSRWTACVTGVRGAAYLHLSEGLMLTHWAQTSDPGAGDHCMSWGAGLQEGRGRKASNKTWEQAPVETLAKADILAHASCGPCFIQHTNLTVPLLILQDELFICSYPLIFFFQIKTNWQIEFIRSVPKGVRQATVMVCSGMWMRGRGY